MGRCLDVKGGINANGTNVQIFDCNRTTSQQWRFTSRKEIRNAKGRCLDVKGGINANRTNVQLFECNGTSSQKWKVTSKKEIRNIKGRCLEVAGGKNANGTNVQIYDCNKTKSQHWKSITIAAAKPAGGVAHWQLITEKNAASETISARKKYRLVTEGGQLTQNPRVAEGLYLRPLNKRARDARMDPRHGDEVKLNQTVSIWLSIGEIYLVYKKKAGKLKIGYKHWSPSAEPEVAPPKGIHQWIFKSIPGLKTVDHRQRPIKTKEKIALYNEKTKAYLVYDRQKKKLRWKKFK